MIASTIQFDAQNTSEVPGSGALNLCPYSFLCAGAPLQAFNGGKITLGSSAVSTLYTDLARINTPYSNSYDSQSGDLSADASSFVQPVPSQSADDLKVLFAQPQLLTSGIPYVIDISSGSLLPSYGVLPAGGYSATGGPLISVIPDVNTINALINPIDGSVITQDVYGNPRTFQGRRDIGAVQAQVPGPLPILGFGAAMGWSRRLRQRVRAHRA